MSQVTLGHIELLIRVRCDAWDGDGATDKVGTVWGARDEVVADEDVPASKRVTAGAEAGGGDGIRDKDGALVADTGEPVFQHIERDVDAVRDEAEPEPLVQTEGALDDVFVAVHLYRATVSEMSEHAQTGVAGGPELVERGIAMASGDGDALRGEEGGGFAAVVVLGGECDELCEASGGGEEALRVVDVGRFHGVRRVGTDVAFDRIDEWPFDVDAGDHLAGEFVIFAQYHKFADAAFQCRDFIGDEGGEDVVTAVLDETLAGVVERFGGEGVAVEVGACIAIDLKIERFHVGYWSGYEEVAQDRAVTVFGMNVTGYWSRVGL